MSVSALDDIDEQAVVYRAWRANRRQALQRQPRVISSRPLYDARRARSSHELPTSSSIAAPEMVRHARACSAPEESSNTDQHFEHLWRWGEEILKSERERMKRATKSMEHLPMPSSHGISPHTVKSRTERHQTKDTRVQKVAEQADPLASSSQRLRKSTVRIEELRESSRLCQDQESSGTLRTSRSMPNTRRTSDAARTRPSSRHGRDPIPPEKPTDLYHDSLLSLQDAEWRLERVLPPLPTPSSRPEGQRRRTFIRQHSHPSISHKRSLSAIPEIPSTPVRLGFFADIDETSSSSDGRTSMSVGSVFSHDSDDDDEDPSYETIERSEAPPNDHFYRQLPDASGHRRFLKAFRSLGSLVGRHLHHS